MSTWKGGALPSMPELTGLYRTANSTVRWCCYWIDTDGASRIVTVRAGLTGTPPSRARMYVHIQVPARGAPLGSVQRDNVAGGDHTLIEATDTSGGSSIAAAVDLFFGDLRLAPRSKKTYWHGINKFLRHLEQHEGIDAEIASVASLRPDHVTSF